MHSALSSSASVAALLGLALLQGCEFSPPAAPVEPLRVLVSSVNASAHCSFGAHRIDTGLDLDGNGVLDRPEVTHSVELCDDAGPQAAARTLVRISGDAPARRCFSGGYRLVAGSDTDQDGRLSRDEIRSVAHLCHAVAAPTRHFRAVPRRDGAPAVVPVEAADRNAAGAAVRDGSLQALVRIEAAAPSVSCGGPSSRIASGIDANRNGALEPSEIELTQLACDGSAAPATWATLSLPGDAQVGQTLQVTRAGSPLWRIAQAPGQRINTEQLRGPGGGNWSPTGPRAHWTALAQSADGRRLLAAGDRIVLGSVDSGATWQRTQLAAAGARWTGAVSSHDGQRLALSAPGAGIHFSADGGQSWSSLRSDAGWGLLAASADLRQMLASRHDRQLWLSRDGGRSWQRCAPQADWTGLASSADGRMLAAVARGGRLHLSRDGGVTWQARGEPEDFSAVAVSADGRTIHVALRAGASTLRRSRDQGNSWTVVAPDSLSRQPLISLAVSSRGQAIVAATELGLLWSSSDGGAHWQREPAPHRVTSLAVTPEGLARVALTDGDRIYRAAAATTPGAAGGLRFGADLPVSLRHLGMGVWAVLPYAGPFYVQ